MKKKRLHIDITYLFGDKLKMISGNFGAKAQLLKGQGNLLNLVDPRLGSDFNKEEMMLTINVALLCCNVTSTVRPTMSSVVSMLEGRAAVQELVSDPNALTNEIEAMRKHFESSFGRKTGESQTQTASIEGRWTDSFDFLFGG
ncbi:hypothetical protein ACE6H2_014702 [Prunus campanulata]